jgi:Domain of unknown function (DUF4258)
MKERGIRPEDLRLALEEGDVMSEEAGVNPRWKVRGHAVNGADLELAVEVSEAAKKVRVITAYFPDVLDEMTGPEPSESGVKRRIDDWVFRIEKLQESITNRLPEGWSAVRKGSVRMHEPLMKKFNLEPRELPKFVILHDSKMAGTLEPRGLWVIGTNGRLGLTLGTSRYVIVDKAPSFATPRWQFAPFSLRERTKPFGKDALLGLLHNA